MTSFTIELNQTTADALSKAASERSTHPEELIAAAAEFWLADQALEEKWSAEDIAAIEEGIAQLDRGEGVPHDEVVAMMREKYGV